MTPHFIRESARSLRARGPAVSTLVGVTEVDIRTGTHTFKVDEPPALGGVGMAANPVQYALASLGSCQAITYRFWAEQLGISFDSLTVRAEGDLDIRGFLGFLGFDDTVRPGLSAVRVQVTVSRPESAGRYQELAAAADEYCPGLDLFRNPVPVSRTLFSASGSLSVPAVITPDPAWHPHEWQTSVFILPSSSPGVPHGLSSARALLLRGACLADGRVADILVAGGAIVSVGDSPGPPWHPLRLWTFAAPCSCRRWSSRTLISARRSWRRASPARIVSFRKPSMPGWPLAPGCTQLASPPAPGPPPLGISDTGRRRSGCMSTSGGRPGCGR